ncbi:MAG: bifunctional lysylphosphatidylglycerol flippase/synthetase MprF [Acidobacteria bacterium]|nr:bifunctional lysylphosphatidylglycerol flippase/synthetase MprF [Acidobacteriota bacterium]
MTAPAFRHRLVAALPVAIGLAVFVAALEVLRLELQAVSWHDLTADVLATPLPGLALAVVLTVANYVVLAGYDVLAFEYIGKVVPRAAVVGVSMIAYAVAHNVGFAMLSGASVRYRFYSRLGVTAEELSRIVFSYSVTFWLGLLALGGAALAMSPLPPVPGVPAHPLVAGAGWLLMALVTAYVAATALNRGPLRLYRFTLPLPNLNLTLRQLAISSLDWLLAGAALYALLPASPLPFPTFLGAYLVAVLLGMLSHVPGGVGVFEGLMVLLLKPYLTSAELLPALVVYRAVYYLLPLTLAVVALVADEAHARRAHVARAGAWLGSVAEAMTPRALAAGTFVSGSVLLWSGATPASPGRLDLLNRVLPLGVVEASHFLGSIAGAGLLILSQGLARRLDAAYYLSSILVVLGMVASLLKGFDVEEAVLLLGVLLALRRARPAFDRRAAFFDTWFSPSWLAALAAALAASVWLGMFAFQHVEYSNDLWWQFELHGEASRFLRASVGASVAIVLVGVARLLRHAPHELEPPSAADLDLAARIVDLQGSTTPNLVFLRDKGLLFNEARDGFVMYGVQGRTWVAMGDPVAASAAVPGLVRRFLERCDDFGGVPVFYEIGPDHMHKYADLGFTFVKLGEEATVDLATFTLEGGRGAKFRQVVRRLEKDGGTFRIVPAADVPAVIPHLRAVSDDWLRHKAGAEKGFSLGFFDEAYLARFPVAVVECGGQIVAFSNVWMGADHRELSLDLMRYVESAPRGVMEALLVHLMAWGKAEGFPRFALGMAPLSGFDASPLASLWQRLGALIYEHGESVYSFQGLRAFKDKFHPVWEPRYLAYPGGLRLPRILADTSALIAGGYRNILVK